MSLTTELIAALKASLVDPGGGAVTTARTAGLAVTDGDTDLTMSAATAQAAITLAITLARASDPTGSGGSWGSWQFMTTFYAPGSSLPYNSAKWVGPGSMTGRVRLLMIAEYQLAGPFFGDLAGDTAITPTFPFWTNGTFVDNGNPAAGNVGGSLTWLDGNWSLVYSELQIEEDGVTALAPGGPGDRYDAGITNAQIVGLINGLSPTDQAAIVALGTQSAATPVSPFCCVVRTPMTP